MSGTIAENNIVDELTKLAKLRADGALSDDEFATLKARLLSQDLKGISTQSALQSSPNRDLNKELISDWAAWCLALVPIISILINAILFGGTAGSFLIYLVPIALWCLFFSIDRDLIKKAGEDPPEASVVGILVLAAVFVPMYLYDRSKKLGKSFSSFYTSVAIMGICLLLLLGTLFQ